MFCSCFFFFYLSTHFLRRPSTDILKTFPHDVASAPKEAPQLDADLLKVPLTKIRGKKFRPISRLTVTSVITRGEEGK